MSSTSAAASPPAAGRLRPLLSRPQLIVGAALAAAVLLAWAWLLSSPMAHGGGEMAGMAAMHADPFSAAYLVPAFVMWAIMMVAMMGPSAAPMILLHARLDRGGSAGARLIHSSIFAGTYVLVWTIFAAAAAVAQAALVDIGAASAVSLSLGNRAVAAALLLAAAAYQLTAAKRLCLDRCQSPVGFVLRYWRPGAAGALRLGLAHGLFCVGCCFGLMLLLFVGGVMNLAWVALLGAIVLVEKLAPPAWNAQRWVAAALAAGALFLLLG